MSAPRVPNCCYVKLAVDAVDVAWRQLRRGEAAPVRASQALTLHCDIVHIEARGVLRVLFLLIP